MENPKSQLIESLKSANNVLVTVSANPSVDQLSAAIGLTLMLNKMGKHATAVYSGSTPSTIEFLQPEKTLEKTTDSLRDFIIALDKSKADKLRYKVEENHVKIFITPYRTSLSDKDLEFSQGDFNVDVVVALGVTDPKDLDQAITAHGRILHDATTVSVTTGQPSSLGTINWVDPNVSSLCEMVTSTADGLQPNLLDSQMATALMTGIVAETDRFSNEKTSSGAMSASAKLMTAGANQQLVATKLQEDAVPAALPQDGATESPDGSLQIAHSGNTEQPFVGELPELQDEPEQPLEQIHIDDQGTVQPEEKPEPDAPSAIEGGSSLILEPPTLGGKLTANSEPEGLDPAVDPLAGGAHDSPLLSHDTSSVEEEPEDKLPVLDGTEELPGPSMTLPSEAAATEMPAPEVPEPTPVDVPEEPKVQETPPEPPKDDFVPQTLSDLEQSVGSPHLEQPAEEPVIPVETPAPSTEPSLPGSDDLAKLTEQFNNPEPPTSSDSLPQEPAPNLDSSRDAVNAALAAGDPGPLPPLERIGSQPLDLEIKQTGETGILDHIDEETGIPEFKMPDNLVPPTTDLPNDPTASPVDDPTKPPDVPPPFMPGTPGLDPNSNSTLPPFPGQDQQSSQGNPQNPFNLPPA